jgi:anti-sigma-K factor RskA
VTDHDLLRERCEVYLLGALDGEERVRLQAILDGGDPGSLAALDEAREFVAQLAYLAPPVDPPPALRSRVLAAIAGERPATVVPMTSWRVRALRWIPWAVAAGLLAFAVAARWDATAVQGQLARLRQEYTDLQARFRQLSAEAARNRRVLAVLAARDARVIRLAGAAPEAPQFQAYWSVQAGLVLVGSNVPTPERGRTLQLWVVPKQGDPINAGVFGPDERGTVVLVADITTPPGATAALAITVEPAGGSPQPTTRPAWVGAVSE